MAAAAASLVREKLRQPGVPACRAVEWKKEWSAVLEEGVQGKGPIDILQGTEK